jgi:ubiquinone/menaquinone biosynthesis C-methylase UbiE
MTPAHRVCPWWLGYLLASPLRRLVFSPEKFLAPYVQPGMTVLEPGPGMGFFTLELARRVGPSGRVIAVDIQARMLNRLKRRAAKAGVLDRIDARLARADSLGVGDLAGCVDFTLAFAVVHEMPSAAQFFTEVTQASKPGAYLLVAEPSGHVNKDLFGAELDAARRAGLLMVGPIAVKRSRAVLLRKPV